nr:MAG TPA_asm: hypothetical protein [Caudoviricetes sp.]
MMYSIKISRLRAVFCCHNTWLTHRYCYPHLHG